MSKQTGLRRSRRRLLAGMGALGASAFALPLLRGARAASASGGDPSPDGGVARRGVSPPDDQPRAVLYEEDPRNRIGTKFPGIVQWTLVEKEDTQSDKLAPAVRASVAIPERQMVMTLTLRPNDDKSLPATHIIEFAFALPADAPHTIGSVPGVMMKVREDVAGDALKGYAVKVTDAYYMLGLSAGEAEQAANIAMLKQREWFDVPMVYSGGHRAILAFQKGEAGRRVFAQAFAAWDAAAREAPPPSSPPQRPLPPQKLPFPPDIIK